MKNKLEKRIKELKVRAGNLSRYCGQIDNDIGARTANKIWRGWIRDCDVAIKTLKAKLEKI